MQDPLDAFIESHAHLQTDLLRLSDDVMQMAGAMLPTETQLLVTPGLAAAYRAFHVTQRLFCSYQQELQERALALSIPEMFRRRRLHAARGAHLVLAAAYQRMAVARIRHVIYWVEKYFEPWLREGHWEDLAAFDFPAMIAALRDFLLHEGEMPPSQTTTTQTEKFAGYQNRLQHLHDAVREHETQRRFLVLAQSLGAGQQQQQQQSHGSQISSLLPARSSFLNDDLLRRIADFHPVVVFGSLVPWAIFTD